MMKPRKNLLEWCVALKPGLRLAPALLLFPFASTFLPAQQPYPYGSYANPYLGQYASPGPQYAPQQYAQPQYSQPQYPQQQYAQPQSSQPQYAQPQYPQQPYAEPAQPYPQQDLSQPEGAPAQPLDAAELEQLVAREPKQWQLYQDVFDENTNLVFAAYTMLDAANLKRIAELKPDSIYAYDNKVTRNRIVASWHQRTHRYENFKSDSDDSWLRAVEFPAVTERLEQVITQVQQALPNILALTNQIATVLDNTANATSNLNVALVEAQPMVTNFAMISAQLSEPGGLGVWALGTNGNEQVQGSLTNVDALLTDLANITSNLNAQVQANSNILSGVSKAVVDSDDFIQGLKRHWLFRSAFKTKTNAPAAKEK